MALQLIATKTPLAPIRQTMNCRRNEFFSRTTFAVHHHSAVGLCYFENRFENATQSRTVPHNLRERTPPMWEWWSSDPRSTSAAISSVLVPASARSCFSSELIRAELVACYHRPSVKAESGMQRDRTRVASEAAGCSTRGLYPIIK